MPEVTLRPPTLDDVPAVAAALNDWERELRGRDAVTEQAMRGWWTQPPPFDLARDVVVARRADAVVGYGDLSDRGSGAVLALDVRGPVVRLVHEELERRALSRAVAGTVVRTLANEHDEVYRALLVERGFTLVRSSYRMGLGLAGRELRPVWPDGVSVRTGVPGVDEPLLHELGERSFVDHWGFTPTPYAEWLHWLHEIGPPEPSLWFVAETGGHAVGVAICRPAEYGDPACGWVSTLGVIPGHRGKGIGAALLTEALAAFQARGLPRAGLDVDVENQTGALRLYERAGMRALERDDTWELRP